MVTVVFCSILVYVFVCGCTSYCMCVVVLYIVHVCPLLGKSGSADCLEVINKSSINNQIETSHINFGEFIWTNQDAQFNLFFLFNFSHLRNLQLYLSDFCVVK